MSATIQSRPAAAHAPPLVFVVDDEPIAADLVAELLQLAGFRTRVFHDSHLAAEALSGAPVKPDVLLADLKMPGLNGLELLARGKSEINSLCTVLMTGLGPDCVTDDKEFSPDQCVAKPFRSTTLIGCIRTALAARS